MKSRRRRATGSHAVATALLLWVQCAASVRTATPAIRDADHIKAAYIDTMIDFVQWPPSAAAIEPVIIAVLGDDSLARTIEDTLDGQRTGKHATVVKRIDRVAQAKGAHLLYIARSQEEDLAFVLREISGTPTLTIGDSARFAERGCILGFVVEDNRVRFHVNLASVERNDLHLSSQLLKLATVIYR